MAKQAEFIVGIDLGGTKMHVGIVDREDRIVGECRRKTRGDGGLDMVLDRMVEAVDRACDDAGIDFDRVAAVGVGAPSAIDHPRGVALRAVNLGWTDVPLRTLLEKRLDRPVALDNDVNVAAWGESRLGAGRGVSTMLGVWVGTGIGGGLVLDGVLHRGHFFTAGEIGQMVIAASAPPGQRTVEEVCSRTGMVNALRGLVGRDEDSPLARRLHDAKRSHVGSSLLAESYRARHPAVRSVVDHAADRLGLVLANLATVLSPEAIVLGGGVTEALGETWIELVRTPFRRWVFPDSMRRCRIEASTLGDHAGVLGAALQARDATT
ncbi:MAG: ROK family protein [Planctomycetota bacterium]|jgi:glucokinase